MAIGLNATATPVQPTSASLVNPKAVFAGVAESLVAPTIGPGETTWPSKTNQLGAMLDVLAKALGPGIVEGLTPTATGLSLSIADGVALLNGVISARNLAPIVLPASTSRVWVWLKQDGTLLTTTSTTPPAGTALLLCSCTTGGSGVSGAFDYSGVIYVRGGAAWRETADAGAPGDNPGAGFRMLTKTAGGIYLWTGAAHVKLD